MHYWVELKGWISNGSFLIAFDRWDLVRPSRVLDDVRGLRVGPGQAARAQVAVRLDHQPGGLAQLLRAERRRLRLGHGLRDGACSELPRREELLPRLRAAAEPRKAGWQNEAGSLTGLLCTKSNQSTLGGKYASNDVYTWHSFAFFFSKEKVRCIRTLSRSDLQIYVSPYIFYAEVKFYETPRVWKDGSIQQKQAMKTIYQVQWWSKGSEWSIIDAKIAISSTRMELPEEHATLKSELCFASISFETNRTVSVPKSAANTQTSLGSLRQFRPCAVPLHRWLRCLLVDRWVSCWRWIHQLEIMINSWSLFFITYFLSAVESGNAKERERSGHARVQGSPSWTWPGALQDFCTQRQVLRGSQQKQESWQLGERMIPTTYYTCFKSFTVFLDYGLWTRRPKKSYYRFVLAEFDWQWIDVDSINNNSEYIGVCPLTANGWYRKSLGKTWSDHLWQNEPQLQQVEDSILHMTISPNREYRTLFFSSTS